MPSTRRFLTGKLSVPECVTPPTPPESTTDHSVLINRDLPDQHPIEAITGLLEALEKRQFVPGMNMFHLYTSIEPVIGKFYAVNKAAFIGPTSVGEGVWGFITMEMGTTSKRRLFLVQATVVEGDEEAIPDVEYVQISYVWELTPSNGSDFTPGMNMFMGYFGRLPVSPDVITIRKDAFIAPPIVNDTVIGFLIGEGDVAKRLFVVRCVIKEATTTPTGVPAYELEVKLAKEIPDVESSTPTQNGVPVGTIITSMLYAIPDGYLNCNGEVYSIADYPDLAAAFVTSFGKSNQFGGDGETTFAVPNLSDGPLYGTHNVAYYIKY